MSDIILTALETLPNSEIDEHFGIVSAFASNNLNFFQTIALKAKLFFGYGAQDVDKMIEQITDNALKKLSTAAATRGANVIIALRINVINPSSGQWEVQVYGTAIKASLF